MTFNAGPLPHPHKYFGVSSCTQYTLTMPISCVRRKLYISNSLLMLNCPSVWTMCYYARRPFGSRRMLTECWVWDNNVQFESMRFISSKVELTSPIKLMTGIFRNIIFTTSLTVDHSEQVNCDQDIINDRSAIA
jgi:hypothetical protein